MPYTTRLYKPPSKIRFPCKKKIRKPVQVTHQLKVSTLNKRWGRFLYLEYPRIAILRGHYAQSNRRFRRKTSGRQDAANCTVAIVFSKLFKMSEWNSGYIDKILDIGDALYSQSLTFKPDLKFRGARLSDLFNTFFIDDIKITFTTTGHVVTGKVYQDFTGGVPDLKSALTDYLEEHESGVCGILSLMVAFWRKDGFYYYFDPHERDEHGLAIRDGTGAACIIRFTNCAKMVDSFCCTLDRSRNFKFTLLPINILRMTRVALAPPPMVTREPLNLRELDIEDEQPPVTVIKEVPPRHSHEPSIHNVPLDEIYEMNPEVVQHSSQLELNAEQREHLLHMIQHKSSQGKLPIDLQPELIPSVTYFDTSNKLFGILRASSFKRVELSPAIVMIALAMLKIHKARVWIREIVDGILHYGHKLYKESAKRSCGDHKIGLKDVLTDFELHGRKFSTEICHTTIIGQLKSGNLSIPDLLTGLNDFFRENDCGLIQGPVLVAIWQEDGVFYMFDNNERDDKGVVKAPFRGESLELKEIHDESGKACVTWYKMLEDLAKTYTLNVPYEKRKSNFFISRVLITNYEEIPDDWMEFKGAKPDRWVLRGSFHQNNGRFSEESRNSQCTAMCAIALAYNKLIPMEEWNSETIDKILLEGDVFYTMVVEHLKETNKFEHPHLMVGELLKAFTLSSISDAHSGKLLNLEINDCLVNGVLTSKDSDPVPNLKKGIEQYFAENDAGVITARGISVSIWRADNVYYCFDSHSRDGKGLYNAIGAACVIRTLKIDELAKAIQSNLRPTPHDIFNISYVGVSVWETDSSGIIKPPLNDYREVDHFSAILQSSHHEGDLRYDFCRNKQSLSMCVVALGMMKLLNPINWTEIIMDEILKIGNKLHEKAYLKILSTDDTFEDDLDLTQIETTFRIGDDEIRIMLGNVVTSVYENEEGENAMHEGLLEFFEDQSEETDTNKCAIFQSPYITAAIWENNGIYFMFESKEKDQAGNHMDRDLWSARHLPSEIEFRGEGEDYAHAPHIPDIDVDELHGEDEEEPDMDDYEPCFPPGREPGKAYVKWFATFEAFSNHIYNNAPPTHLHEIEFTITQIIINASIINKSKAIEAKDEEEVAEDADDKTNFYGGNWYDFVEIQYGFWIIRGTICESDDRFPEINHDNQDAANAIAMFIFQKTVEARDWKSKLIDIVLKYGDKLHTYCLKKRKKQLISNGVPSDDIDSILRNTRLEPKDVAKEYCLGNYQYEVTITEKVVIGETTANETMEEVLSLKKGLEMAFTEHGRRFVLNVKNFSFALFKGEKMYYMFDPHCRGPDGRITTIGVACLLRFLNLKKLADIVIENVGVEGDNRYTIDAIAVSKFEIQKDTEIGQLKIPDETPKVTAFTEITPGRGIISGTISQEDEKFGRGKNIQSACCAFVALAMSFIHETNMWTKEIIDEVINIGDRLYGETTDKLGVNFDPWSESITIHKVLKEFFVGINQIQIEIVENNDVTGVLDTKFPEVLNLRQGIDKFFTNFNTHGVIQSQMVTASIWKIDRTLYMFDPNSRGPTGVAMPAGTACLLSFHSPLVMSEHILANIPKDGRSEEFTITPVSIHVVKKRKKSKKPEKEEPAPCDECGQDPNKKTDRSPCKACDKKHKPCKEGKSRKPPKKYPKTWIQLKEFDASILLASFSQNNVCFSPYSRGYQAATNSVIAIVMFHLNEPSAWTTETLNSILMSGDQLYKDSYLYYKPENRIVNLKSILRRFYVEKYRVQIIIYKPCIVGNLLENDVTTGIDNFFLQERTGILEAKDLTMTIFQKGGQYYLFDPYDRDHNGNPTEEYGKACLMRFKEIADLGTKICNVLDANKDEKLNQYRLSAVQIKEIVLVNK